MRGHRPIFVTLVTDIFWRTRDFLFKIILEPASHEKRRSEEAGKGEKKKS